LSWSRRRPIASETRRPWCQVTILDDFRLWQERAEEARAVAEMMHNGETRRMMLEVAEGYEKLARRAKERAANDDKGRALHDTEE
jgi:hypothetical protein